MKNVTYVGLCWAMTLGLVAVALGQQPFENATTTPPAGQPDQQAQSNDPLFGSPNPANQQRDGQQTEMPTPDTVQDRSVTSGTDPATQSPSNGQQQPRGELGVWMVESGGPGVAIQRITRGSAAEKAGLRQGDVILQVNGRGAASPQATAQLIHQIPIGQAGTLTVWRDGNQQQLQVTMRAREVRREPSPQEVNFRGRDGAANGELAARTMRLEQQIATLTQQLAAMQKELTALRSAGGAQQANFTDSTQATTPQNLTPPASTPPATAPPAATPPASTPPATTPPSSPPPGFGLPEENPAAEPAKPAATPTPTPPPAADTPFGADTPPKAEEKKANEPKKDEESKKDATDSLF